MLGNYWKLLRAKRLLRVDQKTLNKRKKEFGEGHTMVELNETIVALDELRIATIESGRNSDEYNQAKEKYEKQRQRLQTMCTWRATPISIIEAIKAIGDIVVEEKLI